MIYRFALDQVECASYFLLCNCEQNITSLSLLAGRTVGPGRYFGTRGIGDQRRLRRACAYAQSPQSLRCSRTRRWKVDKG